MLSPLDAKATLQVGGDTITLRLNFRSIALADQHGIDLFAAEVVGLSSAKAATLVKCLAVQEHPDFTEDHTMALVLSAPDELKAALIELFDNYAGKSEGNVKGATAPN